jgi:hypothetical protein
VIRSSARLLDLALRAVAAAGLAAFLGACGSGAVSAPPTTPATLSISPSTATTYSGLPTTFAILGGTAPYIVVSSNQSAIAIADNVSSTSFTIVPEPVSVDTAVVLTVRDSAAAAANATVTVKPRTISNVVTITPSASQPASCGTALCSSYDAEVNATLTQAGVPLANRQVRFDVVSGDYRIITSPPGTAETTGLTVVTTTDTTGSARIRIRANVDAPVQTGLLQITDQSGGFTQRVSFQITPASSATLSALPSTLEFVGLSTTACATGPSADVIVFGGRPPYQISQPSGFLVRPTLLLSSGDRFNVTAAGFCTGTTGQSISVVDSAGSSTIVTAKNVVGTQNTTQFVVTPSTATFTTCGDTATFALIGGSGTYIAASQSPLISASVPAGTTVGSVKRVAGNGGGTPSTVTVVFSDGRTAVNIPIVLTHNGPTSDPGEADNVCP